MGGYHSTSGSDLHLMPVTVPAPNPLTLELLLALYEFKKKMDRCWTSAKTLLARMRAYGCS